jgi:hypothetical protein
MVLLYENTLKMDYQISLCRNCYCMTRTVKEESVGSVVKEKMARKDDWEEPEVGMRTILMPFLYFCLSGSGKLNGGK